MTGPDPRVAVVVITQDRAEGLLETLGHLAGLPERPRIVVVDNASADGTPERVRERFPQVEVLALRRNLGGAARNLAAERLPTPYVAFCDDDSWWAPGALSRAADVLDAHPDHAVLQGHILVGPEERVDGICEEMAQSPLPRRPGDPGHPLLSFVACAAVVRRAPFLQVGGFRAFLGVGGEEEILSHDLVGRGWRLAYVPEVVGHHHASVQRDAHLRRAHGIRNTLWTTWLRRPVHPAAVRTVRLLRRLPRDGVTVRGLRMALGGAPWVLRERAVSPPHVEAARQLLEDQQLSSRTRRYVS
jgi:N-acetylglucosaminyl-diphospho-decaprenol L-rhamnosyltransferase